MEQCRRTPTFTSTLSFGHYRDRRTNLGPPEAVRWSLDRAGITAGTYRGENVVMKPIDAAGVSSVNLRP